MSISAGYALRLLCTLSNQSTLLWPASISRARCDLHRWSVDSQYRTVSVYNSSKYSRQEKPISIPWGRNIPERRCDPEQCHEFRRSRPP
ncbi:hypothetical protein BDW66DRAFT_115918 [Aspergillus desertorum]